ncbi:MAG: glycosyltransferase, partial [Pleurocapsa sp.]
MSRILITTIGSLGDLHPKIATAIELRQRGHNIIFATHKGYQTKIEALGFEFHEMRPDGTNDPLIIARMTAPKTGSEYVVRDWLLPNLRATYIDLMDAAKDVDFMIAGEIVYPARLVAEKLGIPWASSALSPFSMFSAYDPPVIALLLFPFIARLRILGVPFNRGVIRLLKAITRSWAEPIRQLREELELPQRISNPLIDDKFSPYLVLAMFSSVLAKPQPDWVENTVLTGFTFYDGEQSELTLELQQFLKAGEPPLVFTLGSANVLNPGIFYPESIQAATQLN